MTKERFGTTTNLYHNLHYNNRLQLVDIRLGDSSTDEWNWTRGALVFYYGTTARDSWNAFATTNTDNNGNLLRQVNYVPLSRGGNVIPQLDDYTYDALNRVGSMTEAHQNGGVARGADFNGKRHAGKRLTIGQFRFTGRMEVNDRRGQARQSSGFGPAASRSQMRVAVQAGLKQRGWSDLPNRSTLYLFAQASQVEGCVGKTVTVRSNRRHQ
jgi:hypothetical protein